MAARRFGEAPRTKIVRVEAIPIDARLKEPFRFAGIERLQSENVVVCVTSDAGLCGFGEACPVPQLTSERQASVVATIDDVVAPLLLDEDPLAWDRLFHQVRLHLKEAPFTSTAIDTALLDLAGRTLGLSISELLGGPLRSAVEVHGSVGWHRDPERLAEMAVSQTSTFKAVKLYAGPGELRDDLARIEHVRARLGPAHPLLVDVNGLWSHEDALAAGCSLRDAGVAVLEQPVHPDDLEGQAGVADVFASRYGIDTVADERVRGLEDVTVVADGRLAAGVNIGLSKLGGLTAALESAQAAHAAGLRLAVGSVVELGIATAAGLHLAALVPALSYPSYLVGPLKYVRQITWPMIEPLDSRLVVPTSPGLGIDVDVEALAALDLRSKA